MAVWLHRMAVCGEQRWLCGYTGWLYAVSRDALLEKMHEFAMKLHSFSICFSLIFHGIFIGLSP